MKWLVIAVLVLAQQPAKAPEGKGAAKSKVAQDAQQPHASEEKKNNSGATLSPPVQQIAAQNPQRDATDSSQDMKIQGRIEIFTGLLVIVGFLQAGVMFLQWCTYRRQARIMAHQAGEMARQRVTMREQLEAMTGQLGEMAKQTAFLEKYVGHTETTANAAWESARAAKTSADALVNAERPFVSAVIRKTVNTINVGVPITKSHFDFVLTNHGRTPAVIYEIQITTIPVPHIDGEFGDGEPDYGGSVLPHVRLLAPNEVLEFDNGFVRLYPKSFPNDKARIASGELHIIAWGVVRYRDQLQPDIAHETRFCYSYFRERDEYRPSGPRQYTNYS